MESSIFRILVVDDYEPWRLFVTSTLERQAELLIIGEATDGLEAVQIAQQLRPDLILLDIGLPKLNGIDAARLIRQVSPESKILFASENRSTEIVRAALNTGADGYVVKADAASQLLPAVNAVLKGTRFISVNLLGQVSDHSVATTHSHDVAFYGDDGSLVDGYARFIQASLKGGNAVIVVVTESHRASLFQRLEADGVEVAVAIEQGNCIPLDATDTLSQLMVNDMLDPVRCRKVVGDLIMGAVKAVQGNRPVVVCGEIAPTLLSKGNAEGAIQLERLWDEITRDYGIHTLCGYLSSAFPDHETDPVFQRICAEHSTVHGRELG